MIARISATVVLLSTIVSITYAQVQVDTTVVQDDSKAIQQFEIVLTRNPRAGIALDKVYEHHIQMGDLDSYLRQLEVKAEEEPQNAAKLTAVIGLLENQRGQYQKAIGWLLKAELLAPNDAILSFYIAQSQMHLGQTNQAEASFERAIEKNPNRSDRLMIEEALGRLYLRTQQKNKAEVVWKRLESLYPQDILVQERIAIANQIEGDIQASLIRYENLAATTKDLHRKTQFEATAASLLRQLGRSKDAIAKYESLLSNLNPDSWRYKDLRRRIESIFLATQDYDGWIRYLQGWLQSHPEDIDSYLRLASAYNRVRKPELAEKTLVEVIAKAPSNTDLRLALSETYQLQKKFKEAATQLEQLVKRDPLNLEYRIQWGQMLVDDPSGDKVANIQRAIKIWTDLPASLQVDGPSVLLVSKSLARLKTWKPAIELIERASAKDPDNSELIFELGELHLSAGNRDSAIDSWKKMVLPPNDSNHERRSLAEVFHKYEMLDQSIELMQSLVANPRDSVNARARIELVEDYMTLAQLYAKQKKTPEAIRAVNEALNRVSPESAELFYTELQRVLQLEADASAWNDLAQTQSMQSNPQGWVAAATIWSAIGRKSSAVKLLDSVIDRVDENSVWRVELLSRSLGLFREAQEYSQAIDVCNRLLKNATVSRAVYLRQLARLYLNHRQPAKAVEAARTLLQYSDVESSDFIECAKICAEANHVDESVELLKTAVSKDPAYRVGFIQLAEQYSKLGRYEESVAANWKVFELSKELSDQYDAIGRLALLYSQRRRMDEFIGKLRERANNDQSHRLGALWASSAYQSARNLYQARQELEPLVHGDTLDSSLVERLALLAEADRDLTAMISWQERLVQMEPSDTNRLKLGEYFNTAGDRQRACEIYIDLVRNAKIVSVRNTAMEYLYLGKHTDQALAFCEELSQSNDIPWELSGVAFYILLENDRKASAARIANFILKTQEPSATPYKSLIPSTIPQGTFSVIKPQSHPSPEIAELNGAKNIASVHGAKDKTRSSSKYWGPVSDYNQLRGAAKWYVYASMNESERSEVRTKVGEQLQSVQVTDQILHDALIIEMAFNEVTPVPGASFTNTFFLSKEFRTLAKKLLDRGRPTGARLYVASNLANSNMQFTDPEDLELAIAVLRNGSIDTPFFSTITLVLQTLEGKSRNNEIEELIEIISNTRDGSVLNAIKNFCAKRRDKKLLAKFAERQIPMAPMGQLYATAYYWPEYASLLIAGAKSDEDFNLAGDFLAKCLERQVTVLTSQSVSQRQGFLSLVDTPVTVRLPRGDAGSDITGKLWDSTYYLPIELQALIAVMAINVDSGEQKERWWNSVRSVADEPVTAENRQRQAVYRAASAFIEHVKGNQAGRSKYLKLWKEAVDAPELIDLMIAGIQYRAKDYLACLKTCEQLTPTNFQMQAGLTRLHLQAALKSGDIDVSRRVALSLATTRLSLTDQLKLAKTLGELKLNDKALELLEYVRYRMPISGMLDVMNAYDQLGDTAVAIDIAQGIVRSTVLEATWDRLSFNTGTNARADALAYLSKNDGLAKLKAEFQRQFDASPGNERIAIQLANVCRSIGDLKTEATLRDTFGQREQATVRISPRSQSDPFARGPSVSIEELKKILESDPKSLAKVDEQRLYSFMYANKSKQLVDVLTPYLDKTGWCSFYAALISNLETRNDPAVDGLVEALVENYGYRVLAGGANVAHWRYLREKATALTRKRLAETWVAYMKAPDSHGHHAFEYFESNGSRIFVTPFLLELLSVETGNYEAVCNEAERINSLSSVNSLAIDVLLSAAIRKKDWDRAKSIVDSFNVGDSNYKYVSLAEAITPFPELADQAWNALERAEASIPMSNGTFVQLYAKTAKEQNRLEKLDALLERVYERLLKTPTNGMIVSDGASSGWQHELQSMLPMLVDNGRFAECWKLISLLRREPESRLLGNRDSVERSAASLETLVTDALTADRAVDCLLEATSQNSKAWTRLVRLMEGDSEPSLGTPYTCSLAKLINVLSAKPTMELQTKLDQLRKQLIATAEEPISTCLARIWIADHFGYHDEVRTLSQKLTGLASRQNLADQDALAAWHIASNLSKSDSTKAAAEILQNLICPSPDKIESLVQYHVALERGLSEWKEGTPESNPWLDQVILGFETSKIGSDQIVEVAIRMADRGLVKTSIKLIRLLPILKSTKTNSALKSKIETKQISGLATAPAPSYIPTNRSVSQKVFAMPFRDENQLASKIQQLIAIWISKGVDSEDVLDVVEELVLQPTEIWMGFTNALERVNSPVPTGFRPSQTPRWTAPQSIGTESFTKLVNSDSSTSRKQRLRSRFDAPASTTQDKLLLAMLEASLVQSPSEHAELLNRVLPLFVDDPSSGSVNRSNLNFLRWTLALQLLESSHARTVPKELINLFLESNYEFFSDDFSLVGRLQAVKWLMRSDSPKLIGFAHQVIDSIADTGDRKDCHALVSRLAVEANRIDLALDLIYRGLNVTSRYGLFYMQCRDLIPDLVAAIERMPTDKRYELLSRRLLEPVELTNAENGTKSLIVYGFQMLRPTDLAPTWARLGRPPRFNSLPIDQQVIGLLDFLVIDAKTLNKEEEIATKLNAQAESESLCGAALKAWFELSQGLRPSDSLAQRVLGKLEQLNQADGFADVSYSTQFLHVSLFEKSIRQGNYDLAMKLMEPIDRLVARGWDRALTSRFASMKTRFEELQQGVNKEPSLSLDRSDSMKHWLSSSFDIPSGIRFGASPVSRWRVNSEGGDEGKKAVQLLHGSLRELLILKYPLEGEFQATVDVTSNQFTVGEFSFGGLFATPSQVSNQFTFSGGRTGYMTRNLAGIVNPTSTNRTNQWAFELKNGRLKFLVDNEETTSLDASPFSEHPFLAFQSLVAQSHTFSNLAIKRIDSEEPVAVSPKVRMLGATMQGWSSEYSQSSMPDIVIDAKSQKGVYSSTGWQYRSYSHAKTEPWKFENETLEAALSEPRSSNGWNCYHYQRPLDHGETWQYDFWWEPGRSIVIPVIGRTAIHLDGQVLEREWLVDKLDADLLAIESEKRFEIAGSNKPQLLFGQWNRVELRRDRSEILIQVNGNPVGRFELEPFQQSYPGLYVPSGIRKFSVRDMTLQGDWPTSLPRDLWERN